MKRLKLLGLLAVFTVLIPPKARALGPGIVPAYTYLTAVSSITTPCPLIINVTSSPVTGASQMDNPQLPNRVVIEIQNIDTTANLWCAMGSTTPVVIGSTAPIVNGGRKIAPGASWVVSTADIFNVPSVSTSTGVLSYIKSKINFWCLSDTASATSKAAVTQEY